MNGIKRIEWVKGSKRSIQAFPSEAKSIAGNQLWLVQHGRQPVDWKPIPSVGPGAIEIRIHRPHAFRVIYVAKFPEAVYVLHCFEKKTAKISQVDLSSARAAYAEMERSRDG